MIAQKASSLKGLIKDIYNIHILTFFYCAEGEMHISLLITENICVVQDWHFSCL